MSSRYRTRSGSPAPLMGGRALVRLFVAAPVAVLMLVALVQVSPASAHYTPPPGGPTAPVPRQYTCWSNLHSSTRQGWLWDSVAVDATPANPACTYAPYATGAVDAFVASDEGSYAVTYTFSRLSRSVLYQAAVHYNRADADQGFPIDLTRFYPTVSGVSVERPASYGNSIGDALGDVGHGIAETTVSLGTPILPAGCSGSSLEPDCGNIQVTISFSKPRFSWNSQTPLQDSVAPEYALLTPVGVSASSVVSSTPPASPTSGTSGATPSHGRLFGGYYRAPSPGPKPSGNGSATHHPTRRARPQSPWHGRVR